MKKCECYDVCAVTKLARIKKRKKYRDNKSDENREESPGKEVEVVWACDKKAGGLCCKEDNGNRSAMEEE